MCQATPLPPEVVERGYLTHKQHRDPGRYDRSEASGDKAKETLKQACSQAYPESTVYVQDSVGSRNSASLWRQFQGCQGEFWPRQLG